MTDTEIKQRVTEAVRTGNWFIRADDDGESYGGFQWQPVGKWTVAPDWNPDPVCGGGLHGQGPEASGFLGSNKGRVVCCATRGARVVIGYAKLKVPEAMVLLVNDISEAEGLSVGGDLYLSGCTSLTALPEGLSVGGYLDLRGCTSLTALPEGLSVGGDLDLSGCTGLTALPDGLSVGGGLCLRGCTEIVIEQARQRGFTIWA